ncbi:MAG: Uma2 family endonuclease [Anaerolineae bacterium]
MSAMPNPKSVTVKEYLTLDEKSEFKHEYYHGEIYAMAGASPNHNRIASSTIGSFVRQLEDRPCDVFGSDQRVRISDIHYAYPDISIVCDIPLFDDANPPTLLNPTVLIEVLSSSTEGYDRHFKAQHFRAHDSLQEYLLIAQDRIHVEHWIRQPQEKWLLAELSRLETVIELASIHCTLALVDVYRKVRFEDGDSFEMSDDGQ